MELEHLGSSVKDIISGDTLLVITDKNIEKLYLKSCVKSLEEANYKVKTYIVEAGEDSKNPNTYLNIINYMAEIPMTRTDGVVALGGGVIGDLSGFVAATYLRGIKIIQVPTTLLALVDSSIGGKTGINLKAGKNLLGAFHQPSLIFKDISLLETLPKEIFSDGMAEVIKYGIIADEELFNILRNKENIATKLEEIVNRCGEIKVRFVEEDEFDKGIRQILNFGHTIGHAIEKSSNYEIGHGIAVANGMEMISGISVKKGWCPLDVAEEINDILSDYGLLLSEEKLSNTILGEVNIPELKKRLYKTMKSDKKRKGNEIDIVVPEKIGKCLLKRITIEELGELL
ncbi:3-dehydroquinate synthase [Anaerosphaera multitolerans]|uniref:3-dehydroquinate synthase n=1 Tax=Anaerosphaera multitolerans TaxID=2487351 RepID=A0A437S688_9FIRM|nr:3-dehydroquinate synthase [Anaerosphaera multitolerans]RVU54498.1 3-dehydroquinate synthase [Anaerosphaera multitolerans]